MAKPNMVLWVVLLLVAAIGSWQLVQEKASADYYDQMNKYLDDVDYAKGYMDPMMAAYFKDKSIFMELSLGGAASMTFARIRGKLEAMMPVSERRDDHRYLIDRLKDFEAYGNDAVKVSQGRSEYSDAIIDDYNKAFTAKFRSIEGEYRKHKK